MQCLAAATRCQAAPGAPLNAHMRTHTQVMRAIGKERGGKSPVQIALNWTICKGALPIPGAKNAKQVR